MTVHRILIRGEVYVSLREVARCFDVGLDWVEEIYQYGLLGHGELSESGTVIAAYRLERVSRIVRMHFYQGVNLEGIRLVLGTSAGFDH